jgi:hypothetical protein
MVKRDSKDIANQLTIRFEVKANLEKVAPFQRESTMEAYS